MKLNRFSVLGFFAGLLISGTVITYPGCESTSRLDMEIARLEETKDNIDLPKETRDEADMKLRTIQRQLASAEKQADEEAGTLEALALATGVGAIAVPFIRPTLRFIRKARVAEVIIGSLDDEKAQNPEFATAWANAKASIAEKQGPEVGAVVDEIQSTRRKKARKKADKLARSMS